MNRKLLFVAVALCSVTIAAPAIAGEIKGPPPTDNSQGGAGRISNGNSFCSFSGLNDTPLGDPGPPPDPGGQVQSYGYFMSQFDLFDPSDPAERAGFAFPGFGCNPNRGGGLHP